MSAEVVPLPRRVSHPGDLMKIIRRLAGEGQVGFSSHAFDRVEERGITLPDAIAVLRYGDIKGEIVAGEGADEWKCKVTDTVEGSSRSIGVVVVVIGQQRLLIVTVEWEDR
jgi:Domain of unknown function (DUF4258)